MAFPISAIMSTLLVSVEAATNIAYAASSMESNSRNQHLAEEARGSLICLYACDLYERIKQSTGRKYGVVIFRSSLNIRMSYKYGGYLGPLIIDGWGYSVYAIYWGWIHNLDPHRRGYHNWCVHGYQRNDGYADGSIINIDG